MGTEAGVADVPVKKLRVLAFHGFRTSGAILQKQLSKWSPSIHELVEFTCPDGPFPARGESDVKAIFEGPYFEWMQYNKGWTEFYNYEESLAYIVDYMEKNGPFDGVLGFSQGSVTAGCLLACQIKKRVVGGKSPADLPPIRFYISISGAYLRDKGIKDVYSGDPMDVPTLHFIGAKDMLKEPSLEFLQFWKDPTELHHPSGHTVPRLDEEASSKVVAFLKRFTGPQPSPALVEITVPVGEK
ncbi:hypothetical protein R1sor_003196 [Riccia sorocarpa]|uniref:Serine hydrolase domain-containing protein n=1 Tax=Riccia sorocarpa TaxID=122646 RepID=A0ABD3H713_9MARC